MLQAEDRCWVQHRFQPPLFVQEENRPAWVVVDKFDLVQNRHPAMALPAAIRRRAYQASIIVNNGRNGFRIAGLLSTNQNPEAPMKSALVAIASLALTAIAAPANAQAVITNPGWCAQFYPNANCQNLGPGNPYTGNYHARAAYRTPRDQYAYDTRNGWNDSGWNNS